MGRRKATIASSLSVNIRLNLCTSQHIDRSVCACVNHLVFNGCKGARCSSVVRVFAHGAMGRQINPSWWTHFAISCSSQYSMTGVTKAVVCVILSVG